MNVIKKILVTIFTVLSLGASSHAMTANDQIPEGTVQVKFRRAGQPRGGRYIAYGADRNSLGPVTKEVADAFRTSQKPRSGDRKRNREEDTQAQCILCSDDINEENPAANLHDTFLCQQPHDAQVHRHCIEHWIGLGHAKPCPLCRAPQKNTPQPTSSAQTTHDITTQQLLDAAQNGDTATVIALVNRGAGVNATDLNGQTALINAACCGHTATVQVLLSAPGINVNARNNFGQTALIHAACYGHTAIVQALIAAGSDVNFSDGIASTALMFAARGGHTATVQVLLSAPGINVNARNNFGQTALIHATCYGHTATVRTLINRGADIDAVDNFGDTALTLATRNGHAEVVRLLDPSFLERVFHYVIGRWGE